MQVLLQAVYEYWIECVLLVGIMFIGINLGKFLRWMKDEGISFLDLISGKYFRMKKEAKKNEE